MIFKASIQTKEDYFKYYIIANDKQEAEEKIKKYLIKIKYKWYKIEQVACDLIIS